MIKKVISTILNIVWLIGTGIEMAIFFGIMGIIWCMTIIGIPFGVQCFKFSELAIFAKSYGVKADFKSHFFQNIIWLIFSGWIFALLFLIAGIMWCVTIIGIGKGKICFNFIKLSLMPFGADIRSC